MRLHIARDGRQALRFVRGLGEFRGPPRPRLILLELNLADVPGPDVLAELKGDSDLTIPVVIFSSSQDPGSIHGSYALHANAYIVKPADFDGFATVIRQLSASFIWQIQPQPGTASRRAADGAPTILAGLFSFLSVHKRGGYAGYRERDGEHAGARCASSDVPGRRFPGPRQCQRRSGVSRYARRRARRNQIYRVGYPVMYKAVAGEHVLWILLVLGAGKMCMSRRTGGMRPADDSACSHLQMAGVFGERKAEAYDHAPPGCYRSPAFAVIRRRPGSARLRRSTVGASP